MSLHIIRPLLALLLLPVAAWSLCTLWRATAFFHNELVHLSMMAHDYAGELPLSEWFQRGVVWLPWIGLASLWTWFYVATLRHCYAQIFKRKRFDNDKTH